MQTKFKTDRQDYTRSSRRRDFTMSRHAARQWKSQSREAANA